MKKLLLPLLALVACAALLAACGKTETPPPSSHPASQSQADSASEGDAPAGSAADSSAAPTGGTPSEGADSITGTVEDATMSTLSISDATGVIYLFSTEGVDIDGGSEGLGVGSTVTVHFEGEIQPTDQMQDVTVTAVEVG